MNEFGHFRNIFGGTNYRIDEPLNFNSSKELDQCAKEIASKNLSDSFMNYTIEGLLKALLYYVTSENFVGTPTLEECLKILKKANISDYNTKNNYLTDIFSELKFDSPAKMYYKSIEILPDKKYVDVINSLIQILEKMI